MKKAQHKYARAVLAHHTGLLVCTLHYRKRMKAVITLPIPLQSRKSRRWLSPTRLRRVQAPIWLARLESRRGAPCGTPLRSAGA